MAPSKTQLRWSYFINKILGRPAEESFHSRHYSYSNYYPFQHKAFSTTLLSTDTAVSSSHRNTQSAPKRDHSSSSHLSSLSESSDDSLTTFPSSPLALSTSLSSSISNGNSSADSITVLSSLAKTTTTAAPQFYPDAINTLISASDRAQKKEPPCLAYLNDMPGPQLIDRRFDTEPVLTENIATKLRASLPRRHRVAQQWSLLYSLDQHGVSLSTLYRRLRTYKGPCLLAIKDGDDQVFGAFLNESLKPSTSYYGTGECFLWKQRNRDACHVYPWTGKNEYMILTEPDFIALGGGNGKFGLWIDSDLDRGYSEQCPTFDNDSLAQAPDFACMQLEIWGFRI